MNNKKILSLTLGLFLLSVMFLLLSDNANAEVSDVQWTNPSASTTINGTGFNFSVTFTQSASPANGTDIGNVSFLFRNATTGDYTIFSHWDGLTTNSTSYSNITNTQTIFGQTSILQIFVNATYGNGSLVHLNDTVTGITVDNDAPTLTFSLNRKIFRSGSSIVEATCTVTDNFDTSPTITHTLTRPDLTTKTSSGTTFTLTTSDIIALSATDGYNVSCVGQDNIAGQNATGSDVFSVFGSGDELPPEEDVGAIQKQEQQRQSNTNLFLLLMGVVVVIIVIIIAVVVNSKKKKRKR